MTVDGVVAPGGQYVCYLSWTLAMPGFGMLMVGATVLIASIGWMIVQYAIPNDIGNRLFAALGGIFTLFIVMSSALSLVNISNQYLVFMTAPERPPAYARWGTWVFGLVMAAIGGSMVAMRTAGMYRYRKYNHDWGTILDSRFRALSIAAIAISAYGFVAIVIDALIFLFRADTSVRATGVMWSAVLLCLGVPWVMYLPICYAVPGTDFNESWRRYDAKTGR